MILIGTLFHSIPPAARTLAVIAAVYAIIAAAKQNPWIKANIRGWWAVLLNLALTACGLLLVVPADSLYTLNTFVSVAVGLLGSSGIHGMTQSLPNPPKPNAP